MPKQTESGVLQLGPGVTLLPVVHGSGDMAVEVRRLMLANEFDCLAVPLPESFQEDVEEAIGNLPGISVVLQEEVCTGGAAEWSPEAAPEEDSEDEERRRFSYVPIDPCEPVIAALRIAVQERLPRYFIDLETAHFESHSAALPDPYALKQTSIERFAAAVLPAIPPPPGLQARDRIMMMARRLRVLSEEYKSVLFPCAMTDWPWIRDEWTQSVEVDASDDDVLPTIVRSVDPDTLLFLLAELPFITGLYELARAELDDDENLSVDGIKELLLTSRDNYRSDLGSRARRITPHLLSLCLQYVRNLSLADRRMTPDLYGLVTAARQIAGDQFAIHLVDTARTYRYTSVEGLPQIRFGINQAALTDGDTVDVVSRLPGHPVTWRTCRLTPRPEHTQQVEWTRSWNPLGQCSWPPEDVAIERFRTRIRDVALDLIGSDLARTEKFSASLKDGLDMRETLRNWHTGDLYVKIFPPARGRLDCVVMLFDSPADPRDYPWRITWHAESHDESTLSLFATDFRSEMIGPGIALATYGGAMFLFPPRPIEDIWQNPRFNFADTLEERLVAAACHYSRERHVALLSHLPPGPGWRRLARRYRKKLVHVPLGRFSQETIQQLRMFHVLNGQQIRSFAAHFIRRA